MRLKLVVNEPMLCNPTDRHTSATEWSVLPKLLFASDFPIATPQETMDALWRVNDVTKGTSLPQVPIDQLEQMVHRNSLELLGLPY